MQLRLLVSTQDESLNPLKDMISKISEKNDIVPGYTVTNNVFYKKWLSKNLDFEKNNNFILKEWEVINNASKIKLNINFLKEYEIKLGLHPGLFGSIVADRRLFMGFKNTYTQDYKRRFNDENLLKIIQNTILEVESLFEKFKPNVVLSFQCVTILDYFLALFARSKKIRYFNLKPTRINNRILFSSTVNEPSPEINYLFNRYAENQNEKIDFNEVKSYLENYRIKSESYEGVVKPSMKPTQKINFNFLFFFNFLKFFKNIYDYFFRGGMSDNHVPNPFKKIIYLLIVNRLKSYLINFRLKKKYVNIKHIKSVDYIFFPMHTEPEVSLLVYANPIINQIEIIRMLALKMPIDKFLVIKEHPWMIGKRSMSSYKKLLNIPRVLIAKPNILSTDLIKNSSLVATISGSVSVESVLLKKPVLTFGNTVTNLFPSFMTFRCQNLDNLGNIMFDLIQANKEVNQNWDKYLLAYLKSTFEISDEINLYTSLLKRKNRHSNIKTKYQDEINKLADLFLKTLNSKFLLEVKNKNIW